MYIVFCFAFCISWFYKNDVLPLRLGLHWNAHSWVVNNGIIRFYCACCRSASGIPLVWICLDHHQRCVLYQHLLTLSSGFILGFLQQRKDAVHFQFSPMDPWGTLGLWTVSLVSLSLSRFSTFLNRLHFYCTAPIRPTKILIPWHPTHTLFEKSLLKQQLFVLLW